MKWQSIVFGSAATLFAAFMLPSLFDPNTVVPLKTSIGYTIIISLVTVTHLTMRHWFGALGNGLNAVSWLLLAILRH